MNVEIRESVAYFAWSVLADGEYVGLVLPGVPDGYSIAGDKKTYPSIRCAANALVESRCASLRE
jgi:hypothetical protein